MGKIAIKVPALGESVSEATIAGWTKKVGGAAEADELLVELETDKVTLEVSAPVSGVITEIIAADGDNVAVGDIIGYIEEGAAASAANQNSADAAKEEVSSNVSPNTQPANASGKQNDSLSPAVRKIVAENNLNPANIEGTGKDGRITKGDAINAQQSGGNQNAIATGATTVGAADNESREDRVKMSRLRQRIAERLKESQNTAAILSTFNEIDMTNVMAMRKKYNDNFQKKHGIKLGFMSLFTKAAIIALKDIPAVNAEIDGTDIIYKNHYDIGVAVGTAQGLVVPVVRDADQKSFAGIELEIMRLAEKARDGKLSMEDLTGGTFTISNGGIYGSLLSTPIINPPQSGILGLHKIQNRPVVTEKGAIEARPMMYIALSYDHRIIDGKEAVTFLVRIKECMEDPERMLFEV